MRTALTMLAACAAVALGGCGGSDSTSSGAAARSVSGSTQSVTAPESAGSADASAPGPAPSTSPGSSAVRLAHSLRLRSPALHPGQSIPSQYTCDGRDLSPPVQWSGVPSGTRELVLVMRDPNAPGGDFVHWALAGIAPSAGGLAAGAATPAGEVEGRNSFGTIGYRGPCPPRGSPPHHYVLTLSALSGKSGLLRGFSADQLRVGQLAIATLVGTYRRR